MLAYVVNTFKGMFAVVQRSQVICNRRAVCILIEVGIAQCVGGIITYFFQIFDFFWSKVLPIMGCNIEESDNDLVVFEGVNSSNIFYVQPFTLSWSHKGKDVFSRIIEHGQIWGIFQFLQHRVGGNTVGFCIGNIAIVTDDGKNVACVLVHHQ